MREHWRSSSRWMPSHPTPSCLLIALIRSRPIPEEASEKKGFRSFDVQKGAAVQYLPHISHSQYLSLFFFCCCCCSGINCLKMFFPRLALFPKWSDKKIDGCLFPRRFIFSQWMQPVGLSISRVFFLVQRRYFSSHRKQNWRGWWILASLLVVLQVWKMQAKAYN